MNRLFIAEKPDLAKAIVEALGGGSRKEGYYECGADRVTYGFGHMLELLDPEDYDERYAKWSLDDLPVSHIPWRKKPSGDKSSKDQLKTILRLLKEAKSVVHAGDPDEEGQLLIDEILQYAKCSLPVRRVLINDNNTQLVRRALDNMRDNSEPEFVGMSAAAEARSVGDQLYGYNMTRAYTLVAAKLGYQGVLSMGRVQTPVLGMIVRRKRAFDAHEKAYYFNVTAEFTAAAAFKARYQVKASDAIDDKGRLTDEHQAKAIAQTVGGKTGTVTSADTKQKESHPPLPYNLLKLQADASRKFGYKPDQTLKVTQTLRDRHKLITYNRSDCEYLSDEHHEDAPAVLSSIASTAPMLAPVARHADTSLKSRAFNNSKVSAHHGIIPTQATAVLSSLSEPEQRIYMLIARAYIAQFFPKHRYDQTTLAVECEGHEFTARSNFTTAEGWKVLYKNDAGNEELQGNDDDLSLDLRSIRSGTAAACTSASAERQETKPQPLYTIATLLTDLTRVAKYIKDDRLRKLLTDKDKGKEGEHGGIGTPATRHAIIATLFERGYVLEKGQSLVPTQTAEEFYDALPDQAKYPDMTALWHEQQLDIKAGKLQPLAFVEQLMTYIAGEVANVKANGLALNVQTHACPTCSAALRRVKRKDKNEFFWGCTGFAAGCKYSCEDKAGKPVHREALTVSSLHKCMDCGNGLIARTTRKPGMKAARKWWGCSSYPTCTQTYSDAGGKPDYSSRKKEEA